MNFFISCCVFLLLSAFMVILFAPGHDEPARLGNLGTEWVKECAKFESVGICRSRAIQLFGEEK